MYDIEATIEPSADSSPQHSRALEAVNALLQAKPRASIKNTFLAGFVKPAADEDTSKPDARNRDSLQVEIDRKL